jgi:hypothetical protein
VSDPFRNIHVRATVGILVAYTLVLQLLLGGIAAAQMAAAHANDPAAICFGGASSTEDQGKARLPVDYASCVVCALISFSAPLPEGTGSGVFELDTGAQSIVATGTLSLGSSRHDPQTARGPPVTA